MMTTKPWMIDTDVQTAYRLCNHRYRYSRCMAVKVDIKRKADRRSVARLVWRKANSRTSLQSSW